MADVKSLNRNFATIDCLRERVCSIKIVSNASPIADYDTRFFFDYDIFPRLIMSTHREWQLERRRIKLGDVIIQRIFVPPLGGGMCVECAVRICGVVNEAHRCGFSYETLMGHIEKGVSEFYLHKKNENIVFTIQTRSGPGHWLTSVIRPFAVAYQRWCTRQALLHVRYRFNETNLLLAKPQIRLP
jgi:hypothetical protein